MLLFRSQSMILSFYSYTYFNNLSKHVKYKDTHSGYITLKTELVM